MFNSNLLFKLMVLTLTNPLNDSVKRTSTLRKHVKYNIYIRTHAVCSFVYLISLGFSLEDCSERLIFSCLTIS